MEQTAGARFEFMTAHSSVITSFLLILLWMGGGLLAFDAHSAEPCPANAYCIGPDVGAFTYTVTNTNGLRVEGASEAETIAAYTQLIKDTYQPCTFNFSDNRPPPIPIQEGHGSAVSGPVADYYAALAGEGQYASAVWTLSTETGHRGFP